jgi:sterol desaturase/sphingolipid hydroxylase (fatty acid hydroxylase superfamily)
VPATRPSKLPWWISTALSAGAFIGLFRLERKRPLRKSVEPKSRRDARNLGIAAIGALSLRLAERPVTDRLTALVERKHWGLLQQFRLPLWLETAAAVVLLDYTLYVWHVLTHKAPWLWRFHAVHHVDLDLDASTAIRFHFGELTQSVAWRAAQVVMIGVTRFSLSVWQTFLFLCILFHHSNVRLPEGVERRLRRVFVTPEMHGIHHSAVENETNSNWSSGLTIWDWLHGTLKLGIPQGEIVIGVPAIRDPGDVTLPKLLAMPFEKQPDWWKSKELERL